MRQTREKTRVVMAMGRVAGYGMGGVKPVLIPILEINTHTRTRTRTHRVLQNHTHTHIHRVLRVCGFYSGTNGDKKLKSILNPYSNTTINK